MRPGLPAARHRFVYYPPISHIVSDACPSVAGGWTATVTLEHPSGDADGALIARGALNSGFVLCVRGGRLVFDYNEFHRHTRAIGDTVLAPGRHEAAVSVERTGDGGGDIRLSLDGKVVAGAHAPRLLWMISSTGMDLGRSRSPVTADYAAPFAYPGRIDRVVFDTPEVMETGEWEAQVRAAMSRQ
jgi:arylsulfatase